MMPVLPEEAVAQEQRQISISPTSGPAGTLVTVKGSGWVDYVQDGVEIQVEGGAGTVAQPDQNGAFNTTITIPDSAPPGTRWVTAIYGNGDGATVYFTVFGPAPEQQPQQTEQPQQTVQPQQTDSGQLPNPPEWLTHLTDQDLFNCTVTMTSLATAFQFAPEAARPEFLEAVTKLSELGDYNTFLTTLYNGNGYWKSALNVVYNPIRECFNGVSTALNGTAGEAGKAVGQWLRNQIK